MSGKPKNLAKQRFGALVAIQISHVYDTSAYWLCHCDCGNTIVVRGSNLTTGHTKGCGHAVGRPIDHGDSNTRFYKTWSSLKERCLNSNSALYPYYGGRGIDICSQWLHSYETFKIDMHQSYQDACTVLGESNVSLDRIHPNRGYSLENCRWLSRSENTRIARSYIRSPIDGSGAN